MTHMTHNMVPLELLEQVARFVKPAVTIDITFSGVEVPARMRQGNRAVIAITEELVPYLRFDEELKWFEIVMDSERVHVPAGAIISIEDQQTGEGFVTDPSQLKESH